MTDIIARSMAKGLRMTDQRRVIARVLGEAFDHPDVEELYARAALIDARISLATVYRTVKVIEFVDPEIEALQEKIAARLGYQLIGHRLELLGVPTRKDAGQV